MFEFKSHNKTQWLRSDEPGCPFESGSKLVVVLPNKAKMDLFQEKQNLTSQVTRDIQYVTIQKCKDKKKAHTHRTSDSLMESRVTIFLYQLLRKNSNGLCESEILLANFGPVYLKNAWNSIAIWFRSIVAPFFWRNFS